MPEVERTTDAEAELSFWDPGLEGRLRKQGVKFTRLANLSPDQVDEAASERNQARPEAIKPHLVAEYVTTLSDGQALPALLLQRAAKGRYSIISGMHRWKACAETGLRFNAYLVDPSTPSTKIQELTYTENVPHGERTDVKTRVRQAFDLHDDGMSMADAARKLHVSPAAISDYKKVIEGRRQAKNAGVNLDRWEALHDSTKALILGIKTQEGFDALAHLVVDAGLSFTEVKEILASVNTSKSGKAQEETITQLRAAYQDRIVSGGKAYKPGPGKRRSPRTGFEALLTTALSVRPEMLAEYYDERDRDAVNARIDSTVKALRAAQEAINARN